RGRDVVAYLVDLREFKRPVTRLELVWHSDDVNRVIQLRVETSNDLHFWREITGPVVVAKLSYQGHRVEQNSVELGAAPGRYLKLTWDAGVSFTLEKLKTQLASAFVELPRSWTDARNLAGVSNSNVAQWDYEAEGIFPADVFRVAFSEPNTAAL